jgi:hypothetical protein
MTQESKSLRPSPEKNSAKEIELVRPVFDGVEDDTELFLFKLKLCFKTSPARYTTGESKSLFLLSCLKEPASDWAYNLIMKNESILNDYTRFSSALLDAFKKPEKSQSAMTQLSNLRQGGDSVSMYAQKFRSLAKWVEWNEPTFAHQFRLGLSPKIKNFMVGFPYPTNLNDMINHALRFEERINENIEESQLASPTLKTVDTRMPQSQTNSKETLPIPWDELPAHQRLYIIRYTSNQCTSCGSPDHRASNCTNRRPRDEGKGQAQSPQ